MTGKKSTYLCALLCSILFVSGISDVKAKSYRSSSRSHSSHTSHTSHASHSYPSSHGLSGSHSGGTHSSVSHTAHSYPSHSSPHSSLSGSSGGSSITQHKYPTAHAYPSSNSVSRGLSGSSSHSYPSTNTLSGSGSRPASYPSSNGLSGNTASGTRYPTGGSSYPHQTYNPSTNVHHSTTWNSKPNVYTHHTSSHTVVHHHHYDYRPPTVIHYRSSYGGSPVIYPVYTGTLPPYVYEYQSSGNRYSTLLAGLALYNLGKMSSDSRMHNYHKHYIPQPDEYCKFGVHYRTGNFEEMSVDCRAITYFIYETQPQVQIQPQMTTNIVNQTTVTTNVVQNQAMFPNGTLIVPAITNTQTQVASNGAVIPNTQVLAGNGALIPNTQILAGNGAVVPNTQQVNTVTTTTTQTVSVTDPRFSGAPVQVNPDMECYVLRITRFTNTKKTVPCDLLQTYAAQSLHRNSAAIVKSSLAFVMIAVAFALY